MYACMHARKRTCLTEGDERSPGNGHRGERVVIREDVVDVGQVAHVSVGPRVGGLTGEHLRIDLGSGPHLSGKI